MGEKRAVSVRRIASAIITVGAAAATSSAAGEPAPPTLRMSSETSEVRVAAPTARLDQRFLLVPASDTDKLDGISVRVDLMDDNKRLWPVDCQLDDRPCASKPPQAVCTADSALPLTPETRQG